MAQSLGHPVYKYLLSWIDDVYPWTSPSQLCTIYPRFWTNRWGTPTTLCAGGQGDIQIRLDICCAPTAPWPPWWWWAPWCSSCATWPPLSHPSSPLFLSWHCCRTTSQGLCGCPSWSLLCLMDYHWHQSDNHHSMDTCGRCWKGRDPRWLTTTWNQRQTCSCI